MRNSFRVKWLPMVNTLCCTGCKLCVQACNTRSLEMSNRLAKLVRPDACSSQGECDAACPEGAIQMQWEELAGDQSHGKWATGGWGWTGRVRGGRHHARGRQANG